MFTVEHEFDHSLITLVDDAGAPHAEDITVTLFEDEVTLEQLDPRTDTVQVIRFTMNQVRDLRAALDLPEGAYVRKDGAPG